MGNSCSVQNEYMVLFNDKIKNNESFSILFNSYIKNNDITEITMEVIENFIKEFQNDPCISIYINSSHIYTTITKKKYEESLLLQKK